MKRKDKRDCRIELPRPTMRWVPDPHRRARVIPNKHKIYDRKAQPKAEPFDFLHGLHCRADRFNALPTNGKLIGVL